VCFLEEAVIFFFSTLYGPRRIAQSSISHHSMTIGGGGGGSVDFNIVQYFTANKFSIKEQKIYNGKYTHCIEIFPLETQTGKTNIFYIHSHHTLFTIQYTCRSQRHPKP
jgi:hypothetical protein